MSAGGWFDNNDPEERLRRLIGEADADRLAAATGKPVRRNWRCLVGSHDWRTVHAADRDKYAECRRCGKRDWRRLLQRVGGEFRGGDPGGLSAGGGEINF